MNSNNILKKVTSHVNHLFEEYGNDNLLFHNIDHTRNVAERSQEIAAHYALAEDES